MKNLRIMLKKKKSVPLQNAATFSKCFSTWTVGFTIFEAIGLFQPNWRLGILKVLSSDKIAENQ